MKTLLKFATASCVWSLVIALMLILSGCATTGTGPTAGTIIGDVLTDVTTGAAAVSDVETALSAAQQATGGHGISVQNIGALATAEASALNTSGLATTISQLQSDIQTQLAQGVPTAQITAQITTAQTAVSAAVNSAPAPSN
jgi:hypothetical protein